MLVIIFITTLLSGEEGVKTLSFSGYEWFVKEARQPVGPGPNRFSEKSLRLDGDSLVFSLLPRSKGWLCGEVYSKDLFSYGTFTLEFSLSRELDSQGVFGFFLYNDDVPPLYNEVDFEIARWGYPLGHGASFSVQPYEREGNSLPFDSLLPGDYVCQISWEEDQIDFSLSRKGGGIVKHWAYEGRDIPVNTQSRVHLNLWLFQGLPPAEDGGDSIELHFFSYEKNIDF